MRNRVGRGFRLYAASRQLAIMKSVRKEAAMKHKHMLPCLLGLVVAVVVLFAFGATGAGVGTAALLLVCPVMMFGMMYFMHGGHDGHDHDDNNRRDRETAVH
jgi:hypothetical protein